MISYSQKMLKALEDEDLAEAQLMFQEALKEDSPENLQELGDYLIAMGFLTEAEEIYHHLLADYPDAIEFYIPLAEIAMENNRVDEAFEYLEKIPETSEFYPQKLLVSADLYQMLGIPEVSESKLKEAQTFLPEEPLLEFALAELYFSNDRYAESLPIYQRILEEGNKTYADVNISERIGAAESMLGNFEIATDYLEDAVAEKQTDDNLFQLAFTYIQIKENQKAIALLQQLRALNPHYQSLYYYLGVALQEEGMLEEAREVFEAGLKENPYQVELYHLAAENVYRLHEPETAEKLLKQALTLTDEQDNTIVTLSNLYLTQERYEDVIKILESLSEENAISHWNRAKAANELEDFETAVREYEKAAVDLNHDMDFVREYGLFLREEGRLKEAKKQLEHYLHHIPDDLEIQEILAEWA